MVNPQPPTHAEKAAFLQSLPFAHRNLREIAMHGGALQVPILMGGGLVGLNPVSASDYRVIGRLVPPPLASHEAAGEPGMLNLSRQEIVAQRLERPPILERPTLG